MATQKQIIKVLNDGGKIHNNLLLDGSGRSLGKLTKRQVDAMISRRKDVSFGYDGTVTIR